MIKYINYFTGSGSFESCKLYLLRSIFIFLIGCVLVKKIQISLDLRSIKKDGCYDRELNSSVPKKNI